MKSTNKKTNILMVVIAMAIVFLCTINVSFSFFSARAEAEDDISFYDLNVSFAYWETEDKYYSVGKASTTQMVLESRLSRNSYTEIKKSVGDASGIDSIGFITSSNSCNSYIRFWIEVYVVENIKGDIYFIDSKGNYVDEEGTYVDEFGEILELDDADKGEIVDYAEYFELGFISSGLFVQTDIYKNGTTYFIEDSLTSNAEYKTGINAIKMLDTVPSELLELNMSIYFSFEAVQADSDAVKAEFNDSRGYYGEWI